MKAAGEVLVVGGGVLGVCLTYWLSVWLKLPVVLIEKEGQPARHTTARNTGVVHRPFHLDPEKKSVYASAANASLGLWKSLARWSRSPWLECGTLEVARKPVDVAVLEKYLRWARVNGMDEREVELLDAEGVRALEPEVSCHGGLYVRTEPVTDYAALTRALLSLCQAAGAKLVSGKVVSVRKTRGNVCAAWVHEGALRTREFAMMFNCAGGDALRLAEESGAAHGYSQMCFRGEYWLVESDWTRRVRRNVYAVPTHTEYPFLDPHFVVRVNGERHVGPNAVPVLDPYAYSFVASREALIDHLRFILRRQNIRLLADKGFIALAASEWRTSVSKAAMCARVASFMPSVRTEMLTRRVFSGVRYMLTDSAGFVPEAVALYSPGSVHVLNYNSPGATGAPAFTAYLISALVDSGVITPTASPVTPAHAAAPRPSDSDGVFAWDYGAVSESRPSGFRLKEAC